MSPAVLERALAAASVPCRVDVPRTGRVRIRVASRWIERLADIFFSCDLKFTEIKASASVTRSTSSPVAVTLDAEISAESAADIVARLTNKPRGPVFGE